MTKKKSIVGGVLSVVIVALLFGWLYSRNSLFILSNLVVRTESPDVQRALQARLIALLGRRLTTLSLTQVESMVQDNPRIKKASIRKRWPSTLEVYVEERQPVGVVFIDKKLWWIDETAVPFALATNVQPLILIENYASIVGTPELNAICAWLQTLPTSSWIDEVEWRPERGLIARNVDLAMEVDLGFVEFDRAWRRANYALNFLRQKNLAVTNLDASYPHRVVVRAQGGLRNFENGLNLKELVRRTGKNPAAAR